MVAEGEPEELAEKLRAEACDKQWIKPGSLTLHADRGHRKNMARQAANWRVDMLGHLLALCLAVADEQDRAKVVEVVELPHH